MELYEIYLITNKVNGKRYVGQTKSTVGYKERFRSHLEESRYRPEHVSYLHRAILKYGEDSFDIKRLLKNIPENKIDFYEELWIKKLNTFCKNGCGYNMTYGGQGIHGYKHTEETKSKLSDTSKKYWVELRKNNISEYERLCKIRSTNLKWMRFSDEHKKKLSELAKTRTGSKNSFYGKKHSDYTKSKISEANSKKVGMFDTDTGTLIREFSSIADATKYLLECKKTSNKNASARISKICNGVDKTAYGYAWKFL